MNGYDTYLLLCRDGTIYAGIASDLARRMKEHCDGKGKGAKYTRSHAPLRLLAAWHSADRSAASRLEYYLKRLPRLQKEALISGACWDEIFGNALPQTDYVRLPETALPVFSVH